MEKKRIIVGATGASGMPLLFTCLKLLRELENYEISLIMSNSAKLTLYQELGITQSELEPYVDCVLENQEIGAGPASGSYKNNGMLIVPCSMKTVAGICNGYSDNLILRAADVMIKEQRTLVLAARETPLSTIHLHNLYELSKIHGVRIIPPMMTFYQRPNDIEEMTFHLAAKLLDAFGIKVKGYRRWNGL